MLRSNRARSVSLLLTLVGIAALACGTNHQSSSGPGEAGLAGLPDAGPMDATPETAGAAATGPMDAAPRAGSGDVAEAGSRDPGLKEPTVVYAQDGVLAGLALAGDTLYASVAAGGNTIPMTGGSIISVPKGATGASLQTGATTVIPGISPRALAVVDGRIYWDEGGLGLFGAVMSAPIAGGTPQSMFLGGDSTFVQTRLVIVDGVLDVMASGTVSGRVVWSAPLTPVGIVASTVYLRTGAQVTTIDADGTTVFFFEDSGTKDALNRTILDLDEVEPDSGGLGVLRLWPAAVAVTFPEYLYLVGDATTLYWSDGVTISSFPKAPTATDVPQVVATLAMPAGLDIQLLIDGPNLYALTPYQLLRVAKTGGAPVVLATSPDGTFDQSPTNALGMVVDDAFIYFLDAGHGRILKLSK